MECKTINRFFGYREDYNGNIRGYVKEFVRRYLIYLYIYRSDDYRSYSVTFFWFTPIAFGFGVSYHKSIFRSMTLSFAVLKPNIAFRFTIEGNSSL